MSEDSNLNDATLRDRAVAAARGDAPFDLLLRGGSVADVALGEIRAADVGLVGPLIASVHPPGARGDAGRVRDVSGHIVTPGFIDSHMHVESSMVAPEAYARAVLPRGVTTAVWDPHEFANVAGLAGMDYALDAAGRADMRLLPLVPSCVPSAPGFEASGASFDAEAIRAALERPGTAGLAEVMDIAAVVTRAPRMRAILQAALDSGKPLNGHARSIGGADLQAYLASGISSDHEITSGADLLEKLRAGAWVELRGSHDHLLPAAVEALATLPIWPQTLTLCSDDVFADDLLESGGLDDVIRRLIGYGLPPMQALQAATLNGARRLGRADLGLVAPGRRGDLVLLRDLERVEVADVLFDGVEVNARPVRCPARPPFALSDSVHLAPVAPEAFRVPATGPSVRIATIDQPRFTAWGEVEAEVAGGHVVLPEDCIHIAVLHRHGQADPAPRMGFLRGWGTWRGAFATTVSHDSHNLTVFGGGEDDLAAAANAVIAMRGGMAVARDGAVIARLPLPNGGLASEAPLAEVARSLIALRTAMEEVVTWEPPYLVFKALVGATLACNPGPHQTDLGIADPLERILMPSPVLPVR